MYVHASFTLGEMVGFTDLGNVNEEMAKLQQDDSPLKDTVATHVVAFMVRGIFQKVNFPLAHFPTTGIKGPQLYPIVWSVIRTLQRIDLKVCICIL